MKTIVILLGIICWCYGQFIYPDQFDEMKSSSAKSIPQYPGASKAKHAISSFDQAPVLAQGITQTVAGVQQIIMPLKQPWASHVNQIISRGIVKFALDMDNAISNTRNQLAPASSENIIFSPLSLSGALALVLLGSAGRTFNEVAKILGLESGVDISMHSEIVHQMFGLLLSNVNVNGNDGPQASFASGIFVQEEYPIRQEFKTISENMYKSEVINLDFQKHPREAQQAVNSWVNQRTRGKITDILNNLPEPETEIIIASALYFKGEWNQYFINGATKRKPFTLANREIIDVNMMYNGGEFSFFEDKQLDAKIVGLPYKGREVTMYVILPNSKGADSLKNIQHRLNADSLNNLINNMKNETCIIGLPRMKLSSTLHLSEALQYLGLSSLFDRNTADLSLLSTGLNSIKLSTAIPQESQSSIQDQAFPRLGQDNFIFPRIKDDDKMETLVPSSAGVRRNFFRYEDKSGGYHIEQWAAGFNLKKIRREIRERRRREAIYEDASEDGKWDSREKTKESFENFSGKDEIRLKRQVRPINSDFLNYLNSENFPSIGLDALRNSANLPNPRLFADEVIHKVEIEVTEKGTEAAAATSVLLRRDGNQKRLIADHPFLFFIRHESTKLLLFWGTVNTPTPN